MHSPPNEKGRILSMRCIKRLLPIGFMSATLAMAAHAVELPVLVLNDTNEPPYTTPDHSGFLDIIATEAFHRAGFDLQLIKLPAERGLLNTNAGIEDGELTRIEGLEKIYTNLVRVPEKLLDWEFVAFSINRDSTTAWPQIRDSRVGYIRGWKIYEQHLSGAQYLSTADDAEQLFRLLSLDRIDVALYEKWLGQALLRHMGIHNAHPLGPPLATRGMYIYLHKRHRVAVPAIAAALRAIKSEGLYARTYQDKLRPYQETFQP